MEQNRSVSISVYIRSHRGTDPSSKKMHDFFMSLKQSDGSFLVSYHGEVDVRWVVAFYNSGHLSFGVFLLAGFIVF